MSYILDALKRAEAERSGAGQARTALPASFTPAPAGHSVRVPLLATSGLLVAAVIGVITFSMLRPVSAPSMPLSATPAATSSTTASTTLTTPTAASPSSSPATLSSPSPAATNETLSAALAPEPEPASTSIPAPAAVIIPPPLATARTPERTPSTRARTENDERQASARKAATSPALGTLRDLPADLQREIPPLAVGGFLYSSNPADRSVLINKRLRREGDEIVPGLVLEALQPNGMVFNYRGHRYRSTY